MLRIVKQFGAKDFRMLFALYVSLRHPLAPTFLTVKRLKYTRQNIDE